LPQWWKRREKDMSETHVDGSGIYDLTKDPEYKTTVQLKAERRSNIEEIAAQVKARRTVLIFTDGACSGNPGPGGWGVVIRKPGKVDARSLDLQELSGGEPATTNNRMELTAAIQALKSLRGKRIVVLTTDSKYVMDGLTKWLPKWKLNGWRTSQKKPVLNADLWRALDSLCQKHTVGWQWVKGHTGHPENERCDELAKAAIMSFA
jgi:ribonuclease HI